MSDDVRVPRASKLPFLVGDALLLACAYFIYWQATLPFGTWELLAVVGCVALGAWLAIKPFLLEYEASLRLAETKGLTDAVTQIQEVESVAGQIAAATAQWQGVQDSCTRSVVAAEELQGRMNQEAKQFMEFLQKANDSERAALRLEVEKLRRSEGDWLQVLVRILDHVLALHSAAVRSGQPQLAQQITHFRDIVLDTVRRVGLVPFGAASGQTFDPATHQRVNEQAETPADAKIEDTLAPGYTFQGQPLRRAVVRLEGEPLPQVPGAPPPEPTSSSPTTESPSEAPNTNATVSESPISEDSPSVSKETPEPGLFG